MLFSSKNKIEVELDLSNYAIKSGLKNAADVDTSKYVKKADLATLKSDVDELDINKLKNVPSCLDSLKSKVDKLDAGKLLPVPTHLTKLSDVVKNEVVKKDVYNELVKNVNAIDTSKFVKNRLWWQDQGYRKKHLVLLNVANTDAYTAVKIKMPRLVI